MNPLGVFANAELNLSNIDIYGFDYDYTLASYKTTVEKYIHDVARQALVENFKVNNSPSLDTLDRLISSVSSTQRLC